MVGEAEIIDWLKSVAGDYHRDFKHPNAGRWDDCPAERCKRFRSLLAEFPSVIAEDLERTLAHLKSLNERAARELNKAGVASAEQAQREPSGESRP